MTVGRRMYASILTTFALFAVLFIVFQQYREKEYKIETLNLRLQNFNARMGEALEQEGKDIDEYVRKRGIAHLRVTVVDTKGNVVYDNLRKDYKNIANHSGRTSVQATICLSVIVRPST